MVIPPIIVALAPIQQPSPTMISFANVRQRYSPEAEPQFGVRRSDSSVGCWCRVYLNSRSNKHVIADYNRVAVVEDAAIVDADIIAHMYVVAETDYRAIAYRYIRADAAKQLAYHAVLFRVVAIR